MRFRYTIILAIAFLGVFAAIGAFSSQNCSRIDGCNNCWSSSEVQVTSDLCPIADQPCNTTPFLQQHNAVVDTLVCACASAKSADYSDPGLNKQIEDAYFAMLGGCTDDVLAVPIQTRERNGVFCVDAQPLSVRQLCESPGQYLAKRPYG